MGQLLGESQEEHQGASYNIQPRNTPTPDVPTQEFYKYRIQAYDLLTDIEHKLKGEIMDLDGTWKLKYGAWCNDEGISVILSLISDYANKNVYLGNITKEEIFYKCRQVKRQLARLLLIQYHTYAIDKSKRSLILRKVVDSVHLSLSRCEDGKEADQLSTATQRHEIAQISQQGEVRSFNPLKGFRR